MHQHEAWDDLPDPWEGNHNIEYWVWHGDRLIPAAPEELEHIQEEERTREALFLLEQMQARQRQQVRSLPRRVSVLGIWCASHVHLTVQWLWMRRRHGLAPHTEGARAERSSTR